MHRSGLNLPWKTILALAGLAATVSPAWAQGRVSLAPTSSPIIQAPSTRDDGDALSDAQTFVSFIDNALPRTQLRTYVDDGMRVRRPTRAEYFQAKGGLPFSPGPPLPESSLDYFDLRTYGELVILPRLSTFINTGFRWVNPHFNRNDGGLGDSDLGFKLGMISTSDFLLTLQLRAYVPTASTNALGTRHFSVEPALLFNYRILQLLTLEGEGRFWTPVGGTDFAGDIVRYGLGLSYQQSLFQNFWVAPVLEGIGWSVLGGQAMAVNDAGGYFIESAAGTTIFNMFGGLRFGMGNNASLYAGYGRALTGPSWYKDLWRVELRFFF